MAKMTKLKDSFSKLFAPKEIRLAVVGSASSGKSFLLRDIIDAIKCMKGSYYDSPNQKKRYGFTPTSFDNYSPNQKGSAGKTDIYACRQENHYGGHAKCMDKFKFDLSFLNIPGEIFHEEKNLRSYSELRNQLQSDNKLFAVHTFTQPGGGKKLIVTPHDGFKEEESGSADRETTLHFEYWTQIQARLKDRSYIEKDSKTVKIISGKYLLEHFFKYDTDSVMSSIGALIHRKAIPGLSFDYIDFNEKLCTPFVFFHYCTLATDIIVCDRIYSHRPEDKETITFDVLTDKLTGFLNDYRKAQDVNVYLALRNVDFMLNEKKIEESYQNLYNQLIQYPALEPRNVIYSLFSYLLFRRAGYSMGPMNNDIRHILGLGEEATVRLLENEWPGESTDNYEVDDSKLQQLTAKYLDVSGGTGHVMETRNVEQHIRNRIGGSGQCFNQLLVQTGKNPTRGNKEVTPHVYFTCTPITEEFEVYKNGVAPKNPDPHDFYRDDDPVPFSHAGSKFCFGSFQLCLDLLYQHGIRPYDFSGMLSLCVDLKN